MWVDYVFAMRSCLFLIVVGFGRVLIGTFFLQKFPKTLWIALQAKTLVTVPSPSENRNPNNPYNHQASTLFRNRHRVTCSSVLLILRHIVPVLAKVLFLFPSRRHYFLAIHLWPPSALSMSFPGVDEIGPTPSVRMGGIPYLSRYWPKLVPFGEDFQSQMFVKFPCLWTQHE